jgi:magnesium-transporting ATPase (P-type)
MFFFYFINTNYTDRSFNVDVDEALLTGESLPVNKE